METFFVTKVSKEIFLILPSCTKEGKDNYWRRGPSRKAMEINS